MAAKKKILVVDDNAVNRAVLCKILSAQYTVIQATNGQDALHILEKDQAVSAILLDLLMPVMDGYEFLQRKQAHSSLAGIPVIVTTQKEGADEEIAVLSRGASDFMTKPYNPTIIQHRLANLIQLRETVSFASAVEHDTLTGLYNKEAFYERAGEAIRGSTAPYDAICIDIQNFKLINDLYGERVGDTLLCHIADQLTQLTDPKTCFLSRLTGDIFSVVLPRRPDYQQDLIAPLQSGLAAYPLGFRIDLRFGIYQIDDRRLSVRAICDRSRLAVQSIKGNYQKHCAYYDDHLRRHLLWEQKITNDMQSALEGRQFHVYYQPKYCLATRCMVGAEALVRWVHPEYGLMSPDKFVPLFEKNGFITEMDTYVWEQACSCLYNWRNAGYTAVPLSVNVSRVDIYNPKLPDILCHMIDRYHLPPDMLHLEITETAYTESPEQLIRMVSELKSRHFTIEMDDFGSGYSSLNMLNEVPVDLLKLDMRFLQKHTTGNRSSNIINFVVRLAEGLHLGVIAEGIETRDDFTYLQTIGCNYGQGYYFSKPLPQQAFELLLQAQMAKAQR